MRILFAEYASKLEDTPNEDVELVEEEGHSLNDQEIHMILNKSNKSNELEKYLEKDMLLHRQKLVILKWWEIHSPKYPVLEAIVYDIQAVPHLHCMWRLHLAPSEGSSTTTKVF